MRSARKPYARATASGESAVIDTFIDLYVAWRECSGELDVVYRQWGQAGTAADRRSAFAAFSRALDDEEGAALRLAQFANYAARTLSA